MKRKTGIILCAAVLVAAVTVAMSQRAEPPSGSAATFDGTKIVKTEEEWKKLLTPAAFHVLREKGTERAYTGKLTNNKRPGVYACGACGLHVFSSKHKYDSDTGWPSFYQVIDKANVADEVDNSIASEPRTEVLCARCGSHLGHVFDDGPEPTGLRYCINSVALKFVPEASGNRKTVRR